MSYEFNRDDAFSFARFIGAEYKEIGDELNFKFCPRCRGGGTHQDKNTFAISLTKGTFNCLRSSCDYHGHFVELCRDFDYPLKSSKPKIYRKLKQPHSGEVLKSDQVAVEYMASRGIGRAVTERYHIMSAPGRDGIIMFPFFDDKGVVQFIKYRNTRYVKGSGGSKEWCSKDTMPILFGMMQCTDFEKPLIFTEGQMDSVSLAEAGIENAVSVPTGQSGMTWVAPCWDWMCRFKEVIVFGDWENGRMTLIDKLRTRLPMTVRAVRQQDYLGEKDANDILRKFGKEALRIAVENAEIPKLDNVKDLSTVRNVDINDLDKIYTQIPELDKAVKGLCVGQVVLLTGKRGDGKSTFMSQIVCAALEQKESVFVYSGELADFHFKRWLDFQLAGQFVEKQIGVTGDYEYSIDDENLRKISDWYSGRAFIFDNDYIPAEKTEYETLPETIEKVIKQYGTKLICIDNLMTAMDNVTQQSNLYLAQSNFVGALKKIAMKYQVVIILVAHPRKSQGDFSNDDVSGSSDITNKVDIVLNYKRDPDGCEDGSDSILEVTKNRLWGALRTGKQAIKLKYSPKSKRVFGRGDAYTRNYGWTGMEEFSEMPEDEVTHGFNYSEMPDNWKHGAARIEFEEDDGDDIPFKE